MTNPAKNPTQWFTGNRHGTITTIGNLLFQDNLGNLLVDNTTAHNTIVTTPVQLVKQPATVWAPTAAS